MGAHLTHTSQSHTTLTHRTCGAARAGSRLSPGNRAEPHPAQASWWPQNQDKDEKSPEHIPGARPEPATGLDPCRRASTESRPAWPKAMALGDGDFLWAHLLSSETRHLQ